MARAWLLLFLALGCPALPTDRISFPPAPEAAAPLRLAQGVGGAPFPSLAPPITLLVDGKQQLLVVCLVLDAAPPGRESPIWFSAGNGSALDAFIYGPSPAADGTWTSLAQLSLPSEGLASWDTLACHAGLEPGDHSRSTRPLQLSGENSSSRTCPWEPVGGTRGQALRLEALRLLLFKLLLLDVLLTCGRLRGHRPLHPGLPAPASGPQPRGQESPPPLRLQPPLGEAQGSACLPRPNGSRVPGFPSPRDPSLGEGRSPPTGLGLVPRTGPRYPGSLGAGLSSSFR